MNNFVFVINVFTIYGMNDVSSIGIMYIYACTCFPGYMFEYESANLNAVYHNNDWANSYHK